MLAVAVSQSGGSPDLVEPIRAVRTGGGTTVALVNAEGAPLSEAAEWTLPPRAGPERALAGGAARNGHPLASPGLKLLAGEKVPKVITLGFRIYTGENAGEGGKALQ